MCGVFCPSPELTNFTASTIHEFRDAFGHASTSADMAALPFSLLRRSRNATDRVSSKRRYAKGRPFRQEQTENSRIRRSADFAPQGAWPAAP
jgi:hypothetical protein